MSKLERFLLVLTPVLLVAIITIQLEIVSVKIDRLTPMNQGVCYALDK